MAIGFRQLQVKKDHELERTRRRCVLEQIRADPVDLDTALFGQPVRLIKSHLREIDTRYLPTFFGQPNRVSALTAGEIERPSRCELFRLRDEKAIGPFGPEEIVSLVTAVPDLFAHVLLDSA